MWFLRSQLDLVSGHNRPKSSPVLQRAALSSQGPPSQYYSDSRKLTRRATKGGGSTPNSGAIRAESGAGTEDQSCPTQGTMQMPPPPKTAGLSCSFETCHKMQTGSALSLGRGIFLLKQKAVPSVSALVPNSPGTQVTAASLLEHHSQCHSCFVTLITSLINFIVFKLLQFAISHHCSLITFFLSVLLPHSLPLPL